MSPQEQKKPEQLFLFGAEPPAAAGAPPSRARIKRDASLWKAIDAAAVPEDVRALADCLPDELRLGTSSWSFGGWAGIVYGKPASDQKLAREGLAAYAKHPLLRTVGIDRSYYAPLTSNEFARYAADTPEPFRFLVKAWEEITCPEIRTARREAGAGRRPSEHFLDARVTARAVVEPFVSGLGAKAGPLVFQFTPMSRRLLGEPTAFLDRLSGFLRSLPPGPLYAVEIRNRELLTEQYRDLLAGAGVAHCFTVHPSMPPFAAQAQLLLQRQSALVVRWMLNSKWDFEGARVQYAPFDRLVDEDVESRIAISSACIDAIARGLPVYVIANNKAEGSAPLTIFRLAAVIAEKLRQGRG